MNKAITICFLLFLNAACTFSQMLKGGLNIGGKGPQVAYSIALTKDDGYVLAGYADSLGYAGHDVYVCKLDSNGKAKWIKTIGLWGNEMAYCVIVNKKGNFVVTGYTTTWGAGSEDVYVLELDQAGNMVWEKTIGGTGNEVGRSIIQMRDGGYAISGYTDGFGAGNTDMYIVKIDSSGNLKWTKTIGTNHADDAENIVQASNGDLVMTGTYDYNGFGATDAVLIRMDSAGNVKWSKASGTTSETGYALTSCKDGGFALTGYGWVGSNRYWDVIVRKTDSLGNIKWITTIGGKSDDWGNAIVQTKDGGYAIAGYTGSYGPGTGSAYLVKLDSSGILKWTQSIGGSKNQQAMGLMQTKDGGYAIAAYSNSYADTTNFYGDMYFIKTDSLGKACNPQISDSGVVGTYPGFTNVTFIYHNGGVQNWPSPPATIKQVGIDSNICSQIVSTVPEHNLLQNFAEVYPNPNNGKITVALQGAYNKSFIIIYNAIGQKILWQRLTYEKNQIILPQITGIYFYRILNEDGKLLDNGKFIIQ